MNFWNFEKGHNFKQLENDATWILAQILPAYLSATNIFFRMTLNDSNITLHYDQSMSTKVYSNINKE